MLAFLISPLGRRIAAVLAIVAVLAVSVKLIQRDARIQGQLEGQRKAWEIMERTNREQWAEVRMLLEAQQIAANKQMEDVRKMYSNFLQDQRRAIEDIRKTQAMFDLEHGANRAEVIAALPETPAVIQQELKLYQSEVAVLREDLMRLAKLLENSNELSSAKDAAHDAVVKSLQAEIAQLKTERDFYAVAFKESAPKKGCGLFKKIITLGICR